MSPRVVCKRTELVHYWRVHVRGKLSETIAAAFMAAALALAGCTSITSSSSGLPSSVPSSHTMQHSPSARSSTTRPTTHPPRHKALYSALVVRHDPDQVTGTLTEQCHGRDSGRLPDPHCTPGGIDPAVTQADIQATICASGYTERVRPPESQTQAFKFDQAYPAYGIPSGDESELDHLVPLELGGDNDAANLWPEVGSVPNPKDAVEDALNQAVCDGRVSLARAQRAIARNWETAESRLGLGAAPPAPAPSKPARISGSLSCGASVSNAAPADYATVDIYVRTAPGASVTTIAHYKTTDHPKSATANSAGHATIAYYISRATPGYTVDVDVTVSAGSRSSRCATSFTPVG
jgi:hypothetical protein